MKLALFDLDNTLLAGDSDVLWTEFLIEEGAVSPSARERSDRFYRDYEQGRLEIEKFLEFQLQPMRDHETATLLQWRSRFMRRKVLPLITGEARRLVKRHQARGHRTVIVTATNRFTTAPIADELGVDALLATELERFRGRFTGRMRGTPCFREGKIHHLQNWLQGQDASVDQSWFYSDSANDLPLLEWVDHPTAVDPDPRLRTVARTRGWPIISLRRQPI